jgi:AcrR family transcriptional regulator
MPSEERAGGPAGGRRLPPQASPDDLWPPLPTGPGQPRPDRRDDPAGRRGRDRVRPRLSREEIIDAAIAIADAEGAEALSMRRIAQVLRAGTMSLYWHVPGKERLLELMRDMLMAEVAVPEPSGDWRADLRATAVSLRGMLSRHRWLMDFVGARPPLGPTTLLTLEAQLAMLAVLDLGAATDFDILTAVTTYVSGVVQRETQELRSFEAERALRAEAEDFEPLMQAWRDRLAGTGLFPHVVSFMETGVDPDAIETMEHRFEFGLDCLLDGIAARIGRR